MFPRPRVQFLELPIARGDFCLRRMLARVRERRSLEPLSSLCLNIALVA
jgi:hypothetical protein